MKKALILLALVGTCSLFAQKLVPDPCNLRFYAPTNAPLNWYIQASTTEKDSVTYNELGNNKRTMKITPKKNPVLFYYGGAIKAAKGDVIIITVKAKGKGKLGIGYMSYYGKSSNNFSKYEYVEATNKEQTFTKTFEIMDNPKNGTKTEFIRIAVNALTGSDVTISSINAAMEE